MFNVTRFDPREADVSLKKKHTKSQNDVIDDASSSSVPSSGSSEDDSSSDDDEESITMHAPIAPDQSAPGNSNNDQPKRRKINASDEAIDDFDMNMDVDGTKDMNIRAALQFSEMSIEEAGEAWRLAPFLLKNLKEDEYEHFFPIQCLVIPDVIASERHSHLLQCRDVCVSAPTGSGKTLSFVLPVLNALANRNVQRLRALVVLPSRDLAEQVYHVFERYARGSHLHVGLAIGQTDFETEQQALVIGSGESVIHDQNYFESLHALKPYDVTAALNAHSGYSSSVQNPLVACGGQSAVDILIATPGRLIDHLEGTPGFTLQHLRFLVIDEADRLLNQSYQNWIHKVQEAVTYERHDADDFEGRFPLSHDGLTYAFDPTTCRERSSTSIALDSQKAGKAIPLRKLLFSATLTKDPQKLAALGLVHPKHFDVAEFNNEAVDDVLDTGVASSSDKSKQQKYSIPSTLEEYTVECSAQQKPLVLAALLLEFTTAKKDHMSVVFTSSIDSTHRLTRLLQLFWASAGYGPTSDIAEYSGQLKQKHRHDLLERCRNGDVGVLVCSDGMSRGMDLDVNAVIHYDVPSYAKTYVHRCGRTARAGKKGVAISILKTGQRGKFMKMRELLVRNDVQEKGIQKDLVSAGIKIYTECVKRVKDVLEDERNGELDFHVSLKDEYLVK